MIEPVIKNNDDSSTPPAHQPATDSTASQVTGGPDAAKAAASRFARVYPTLEQLAQFYPHLFGKTFRPLKRGIFQELMAAHPDVFDRDALKEALAQHTRSTRYLAGVAAGQPRHDLQGQVVEAMAPEHVYRALIEVFRRRQARSGEDLHAKLRERIVQAFEASGLSRGAYDALVRSPRDEAANAVLDEALAEAAVQGARHEALLRAFEASGKTIEAFADMYGLAPDAAAHSLERAGRHRAIAAS